MSTTLLDLAQKLAQGGRAKVAEERQRLEKLQAQAQAAGGQRQSEIPASGR
jgi:hypothetical protein